MAFKPPERRSTRRFQNGAEYWLSVEMAAKNDKGFAHIQGSILLSDNQIQPFKKLLHKINGKVTPEFKNYAVRTRENRRHELIQKRGRLYTDINWALYNTKESGRVGYQFTGHRRNISVRQDLTKMAKQLYCELKAFNSESGEIPMRPAHIN